MSFEDNPCMRQPPPSSTQMEPDPGGNGGVNVRKPTPLIDNAKIDDSDIRLVAEQAECSEEIAERAIREYGGDLTWAIVSISLSS